ncbi:oligoendopeptidase F [Caldanaerobacter subterraneus subsp. tengcongensis MB4]|jgi:oligoendopeptidase F|uniref:Oligopeptidase F n=1 Tax=Caldanaerobacter subterraneus subsp. tengcongensis (strain DSM 15242 / JCM 11007 / NBRC 100824 / MB4) TaxID=273068 RepID=Q8RB15_CALS4|nr:oligoendopeptidase F [Caldanaerobacter subterraneus]AAM24265.1 Oligoendopeptidase F [Caldanaerobacter subterraneus subsp. tengcongensis MB4]MCS3916207.1 oligoendopeptidase F [Caldanaerobacter subterraneus subsp. tengcongensis MB4]
MGNLRERSEIDERYKWRLEDIYENEELWEEDYRKVKELLKEIVKFKGKIRTSKDLLEVLKLNDQIGMTASKIFAYARMRRDEDNTNSKYQALSDKAMRLNIEVMSATSFIVPEILSIETEKLRNMIEELEELKIYKQYIEDLIRYKPHVLSPEEEKILAEAETLAESVSTIYSMLNHADLRFPTIKDENGNEVELTHGNFISFMQSKDRNVRKAAFEALYDTYKKFINTFASTLAGSVKKDIFYAKARRYNSSLEASLFEDNVSVEVYNNLIETVHSRLDVLHRYVRLKKKLLKLDELYMYDLYVPLIQEYDKEFTYEEAIELVLEGLKPLGEEYIDLLKKGFESRWVDVYENRGKTSGAYSWGAYGTHPYVLLNFQGKLNDVFTIAHEMGHSLHTYYSNATQPYVYAGYKIFVAEVASTCNEAILMDYLLKNSKDEKERLYVLNHFLEEFRGTVFRQVMFAEFEKLIHEMAERGEPLTAEVLNKKYYELNKLYYGDDIVVDEEISYEWARIPHFYRNFYVYKYATGFSAAIAISQMILNEGEKAVERYKEFLKSGSSDYPLNLLKKAGVDLTTPKPVNDALDVFEKLLDEFEKMA